MRRATLGLTLVAILTAGASRAGAGGLDVRLGGFFPRGNETLFQDDRALYFVKTSDFNGFTGGAEYNLVLARNVELGISIDGYGKSVNTSYRDYTRPDDSEIRQTLHFETAPIGLTLRIVPTGRRAKIAPYLGAGVDAIYWKYEEYGDFICFPPAGGGACEYTDYKVISDHFRSDGWAFGFHAAGGIRIYLNRDFAIVAEGRYQWAKKDMGDDFSPNEPGFVNTIDLSGVSATIGLHVRF